MNRLSFAAVTALLCLSCSTPLPELRILVGTYTEGTSAEGVYLYSFNSETADVSLLSRAPAGNPSFVLAAEDNTRAYAVNEFNDGREGLSSFIINNDIVSLQSSVLFKDEGFSGKDPCNLLRFGSSLISSNYTEGTVSAYRLNDDGSIAEFEQFFGLEGSHMHCAVPSPDNKFIFVTDLGNDCIHRFEPDTDGPLSRHATAWKHEGEEQFGPRHMVFSGDGRFAYLLCELGDKLVVFRYVDGALFPIQTVTAYEGEGHGSADIHISPDGRFLYTSHRLKDDGIAIWAIDEESGIVNPVGYQATGIHPRNFAISPDGRFLLCACRDSNCIEIYSIDTDNGSLSPTGRIIELGAPVCVQFL